VLLLLLVLRVLLLLLVVFEAVFLELGLVCFLECAVVAIWQLNQTTNQIFSWTELVRLFRLFRLVRLVRLVWSCFQTMKMNS